MFGSVEFRTQTTEEDGFELLVGSISVGGGSVFIRLCSHDSCEPNGIAIG